MYYYGIMFVEHYVKKADFTAPNTLLQVYVLHADHSIQVLSANMEVPNF